MMFNKSNLILYGSGSTDIFIIAWTWFFLVRKNLPVGGCLAGRLAPSSQFCYYNRMCCDVLQGNSQMI